MNNRPLKGSRILYYAKYLGLALTVIGVPTMIFDSTAGSEIPLLAGLFILLITKDRVEDERSAQIKTTSLYVAFILSYGVKLITSNLYDHRFIAFELVDINHFLILMLVLANGIFYGRLYVLKH